MKESSEKTPQDQYHEVIGSGKRMRHEALQKMHTEDTKKAILLEIKSLAEKIRMAQGPEDAAVLIIELEKLSKKLLAVPHQASLKKSPKTYLWGSPTMEDGFSRDPLDMD